MVFLGPRGIFHASAGAPVLKNGGVNCGVRRFHGGPTLSMNHALGPWCSFVAGSPVPLVNTVVSQTVDAKFHENAAQHENASLP